MNVVFVAPYFGANMVHCIRALAELGVKVGIVSHQGLDALPKPVADGVAGHFRIDDSMDPGQLAVAVRAFQADWGRVDRLIGYLEQMQVPLADVRDRLRIPGVGGEVARNFRDKNRMKDVLRKAGIPVARQQLVSQASDALRFVEQVGFPVVLKPVDGMGSKGTMRCNDEAELFQALNILLPRPDAPVQCEEFVTGEEHTCETVMIDGKPVWRTSTYYLPGPLKVLENQWMQYCVLLPKEEEAHVTKFAPTNTAALRALGMVTGLSHMEWFLRADGSPVVSEVGARPPGVNIMTMNGLCADGDAWKEWLRVQIFGEWQLGPRVRAAGCAFLRGQGRGRRVIAVHGVDAVRERLGDRIAQARWPVPGQAPASGYEGEGWVLVTGPTTQDAVEALKAVVTTVRVELGT